MQIEFEQVLKRADIQQLRSFLLYGQPCAESAQASYLERIEKPQQAVMEFIQAQYPDRQTFEPIQDVVLDAISAFKDVFLELGMQAGIKLMLQPLDERDAITLEKMERSR